MTQRLNLHIGYHKTGTTSLQRHLASLDNSFNYLGRRYDGSETNKLVDDLSYMTSTNNTDGISKYSKALINIIKESEYDKSLISHENFLRPFSPAFQGLKILIDVLSSEFDLSIFVSVRNVEPLNLSRFTHDLRVYSGKDHIKNIPFPVKKKILKGSLCKNFECSYPVCKKDRNVICNCTEYKMIPTSFYSRGWLQDKIDYPLQFVDLLHGDDCAIFFGEKLLPLPVYNEAGFKFTDGEKQELLLIIRDFLSSVGFPAEERG